MPKQNIQIRIFIGLLGTVAAGCISQIPSANAQSCNQANQAISNISKEIKAMQEGGERDNSAHRATMRAARMTFGAQAQANLLTYGKSIGCKFSGLNLPLSISAPTQNAGEGDL